MAIDPVLIKIIKRCQKDPVFFINNFCKVKHPKLGIIPFKLFNYQKSCLRQFLKNRFNIFRKCRQVGISTLTGGFALWYAMFFPNKTVLIVSKRDDDAKDYLNKNIKFVYAHLPLWMRQIWTTEVINEHTIGFTNGSTIRSLTSSPDTLRSQSGSLNIIDEAAFIDKMDIMWRGGWSCVLHSTLVSQNGSLIPISELGDIEGDKWQDIDTNIQSDVGIKKSDKFYVNGVADTKVITTSLGFELECTNNHRLKDADYEWVYADEIKIGQNLALKCGSDFEELGRNYTANFNTYLVGDVEYKQEFVEAKNKDIVSVVCYACGKSNNIGYRRFKRNWEKNGEKYIGSCCGTKLALSPDFDKPKVLDDKLAELVGYYVGDGYVRCSRPKRMELCYDPQDTDIFDYFSGYFKSIGLNPLSGNANGAGLLRIDNSKFIDWFVKQGFKSKNYAKDACIPAVILRSNPKIRAAFLRGLFEADGWFYNCKHINRPISGQWKLGFSSISIKLVKQVQLMLLDLGVISRRSKSRGGYENSGESWRLEIINMDNIIQFMDCIGFISERKNIDIIKQTSMRPSKYDIGFNGVFYDNVVSVEESRSLTVDISVPDNNTYIANGFVSHNTLQHGGSAIVISTPKGVGNWYYKTWVSAVNKENAFNPILINWWDMDWKLEYVDELSGNETIIAPTREIRKVANQKELEKYGPYWSPWLENEYRQLATKGDDSSFRQEVLAEFIGSGDTVLNRNALFAVELMTESEELENINGDEPGYVAIDRIDYVNPKTLDPEVLDFHDTLHIWKKPYTKADAEKAAMEDAEKAARERSDVESIDLKPHSYVIGADPSTGEANDFCTVQVLDLDAREQVAELKIRTLPKTFAKMIDYIGRMYNNAFVVCERTGIGAAVCQELDYDLMYPNLYRHKKVAASLKIKYNQIGYPTSHSTKAVLVKHLVDNIGEDGWLIRSSRLYHELCIFIHLGGGRYGNEPGTGNTDDLVLALTFALVGVDEAIRKGNQLLAPIHSMDVASSIFDNKIVVEKHKEFVIKGGKNVLAPIGITSEVYTGRPNVKDELAKFTSQLGGVMLDKNKSPKQDIISFKKHILRYFR